jgi:CRISPR system Cascade subunit CasA
LWRDSAALFQLAEAGVFRGPFNLRWLGQLRAQGNFPRREPIRLAVFGLCADQAKVLLWRHEELPLPLDYLTDVDLVGALKNAIELAEQVGVGLRSATAALAKFALTAGHRSADMKRVWELVDCLAPERLYWSRLDIRFREFLQSLAAEGPDPAAHRKQELDAWFTRTLRRAAHDAFNETAGRLDHSARFLRAVVEGDTRLRKTIGKIAKGANISSPVTQGTPK